ncbi:photosystem reaction center subunit H [Bacillus methanolicus]|uniref:PRC-barrel domain-containing protein n=1 Tax=Bacillus methanolicus TaxID=1471 RepID=UPI0023806959|nr:PRC-barrel domain-containing protein [Bacillus methanolicus]MDE3839783.1 photosystem reaction center subunit H [Bacillus methanolicus]
MKKSTQITGLPIISIADGREIGKVKTLVINPEKGSIDFLTIDDEDWQTSVKAIPFKKIVGIGDYAVTVESENAVIDLNEIPIANQLVHKKIKITNTKVMTRKGELLGEVLEYYADEENGQILGLDLQLGNRNAVLPSDFVLTYGKDMIIVKEEAVDGFLESSEQLLAAKELQPIAEENDQVISELEKDSAVTEKLLEDDKEVQVLKDKQIELLNGKRVTKDITDLQGNVIIAEGTVLTREDIIKAQEEGPSVVVELSMNVEA